jgi:hypothetical protein
MMCKTTSMQLHYFSCLVTPGLGAAGHIRRFSKRLIKDDLPTFGYPIIPARTLESTIETISKCIMLDN